MVYLGRAVADHVDSIAFHALIVGGNKRKSLVRDRNTQKIGQSKPNSQVKKK